MENKRLFTQRELEKHINARLVRERKRNGELMLFKNMIDQLMKSGKINADSYAEAGERLTELLSVMPAGNSEEEALEDNNTMESSMENDKTFEANAQSENGDFHRDNPEYPEEYQETENVQKAQELPFETVSEAAENRESLANVQDKSTEQVYGEEHTGNDENVGKRLSRLCLELSRLLDGTAEKSIYDNPDKEIGDNGFFARRSACSTGFSANSACDAASAGFELTPMQRDIARRAGISYREYAELLRDIPDSIKKRKQHI